MPKKLFTVDITISGGTVAFAENEEEAINAVRHGGDWQEICEQIVAYGGKTYEVTEIHPDGNLPDGWSEHYLPYSTGKDDRTIAQIRKEQNDKR